MRIAFFNPQGNFDPQDRYWTEHADFGGQLVYVKELALALGRLGIQVDILTRQIQDPAWPGLASPRDSYEEQPHVRIVRIPFGGRQFLAKEQLWPYLHGYVAGIMDFYADDDSTPDFVTAHYADGGIAAAMYQETTGIPYSFTAHSLGAHKLDKFHPTPENIIELNDRYEFARRLRAEQTTMANAAVHFVSTKQEQLEQYSHPYYQDVVDVQEQRRFAVAPPGVNTSVFQQGSGPADDTVGRRIAHALQRDVEADRQQLPCILAAGRLDVKKNHIGLVEAFGASDELQSRANLVILLRGIENPFADYSMAKSSERDILRAIMAKIDEHQLQGKVCMLSLNSQQELASCYRVFAQKKSVFALTSLYETFGLAVIEAMACGLPVVVTKYGGPAEVLHENSQRFGILVDPTDPEDIAQGLYDVVASTEQFARFQKAGIERVFSTYTWKQTAQRYLTTIESVLAAKERGERFQRTAVPEFFWTGRGDVTIDWLF